MVLAMVNVGDTVAPAETVTEAGTVTLALLLASVTTAPPDGAFPFSVTKLPDDDAPPTRGLGDRFTTDTDGAVTVRIALFVLLFADAVIVTVRLDATGVVVIRNVGETV